MAVSELPGYGLALGAGIVLGVFYFGGLWWTTQRLLTVSNPALLALASFVVRTVLTLAGFYLVAGSHWVSLIVSLAGFLLARTILVRRWGPPRTL
jgi:F1F0 ATPase subunit 2